MEVGQLIFPTEVNWTECLIHVKYIIAEIENYKYLHNYMFGLRIIWIRWCKNLTPCQSGPVSWQTGLLFSWLGPRTDTILIFAIYRRVWSVICCYDSRIPCLVSGKYLGSRYDIYFYLFFYLCTVLSSSITVCRYLSIYI